jgi:hypothetical protein
MQLAHENVSTRNVEAPYLSVVVTARNDDHGGSLLRRMQVFVDAWINQAKRHQLPSELILVEWNPPPDRERLVTALRWPSDTGPCKVRVIEVPPEVHARYYHSTALALYQMIAKNVGIRRARGEFILATNIDIVFSDELMMFLAERRLEKGHMYRIDRTDVMSDVPVNDPLDEQLAYCQQHVIRLCAREGIYPVTRDGFRQNEVEDITAPGSGIHFGSGWFPVERWEPQEPFRWIADEAEILLANPPQGGGVVVLEAEAGPGVGSAMPVLQVLDKSGSLVAEWIVKGRTSLELLLPQGTQSFRLRAPAGGLPVVDDPRILNFRFFRCDWAESQTHAAVERSAFAVFQEARPTLMRMLAAWRASHGIASLLVKGPGLLRRTVDLMRKRGDDIFEAGMEYRVGQGWYELERAGAEWFRWVSEQGQLAVRITEQMRSVALVVEPGPGLGFQPFTLLIRDSSGQLIARAPVSGVTYLDVALPIPCGTLATLVLSAEGGTTRTSSDERALSFRVYACGGGVRTARATATIEPRVARFWMAATIASRAPEVNWESSLEKWRAQIEDMGRPAFLHLSACGDFTLMAREHWDDLRGYAELDLFSMHLDSLLCCAAHHAGVREKVLDEPMRIYHIEHGIGSGWTPEGKGQLYERLAQRRIQCVSYEEVVWSIAQMRRLGTTVIFNLEDWGLAGTALSEISPSTALYASRV